MIECAKCNTTIKDNENVVWKCTKCGKPFKFPLNKLTELSTLIKADGTPVVKCLSCGNGLTENEKIYWKCGGCGTVVAEAVKKFRGEKNEQSVEDSVSDESLKKLPNLIECPDCGKIVSKRAESCPNCGYAIKSYYNELKQEEEEKRLAEEREQQRIEDEEERKRLQEEREKQHQENMNKYFGSPIKKLGWGIVACVALVFFIMIGMYIDKENKIAEAIEDSTWYVNRIKNCVSSIDGILSSADYVYGSFASQEAVKNVTDDLDDIRIYISFVDTDYKKDIRVSEAIESNIKSKTSCESWEEYKTYINTEYFVADTNDESAEKLVKGMAYASTEEKREAERKTSLIVESQNFTTSGKNYKIYGTVTNNTSRTVYFVKVKVSLMDDNYKVLDTETTYACGDEGIAPGESTKFECYIEKDSNAAHYKAEIYDYD